MRKTLKAEEEAARVMISGTLELPVIPHDDGSQDSMYDLEIALLNGEVGAVEVTAAADREAVELGKIASREVLWTDPALQGAWHVSVLAQARAKRLFVELPGMLVDLQRRGAPPFLSISDDDGNPDPWMQQARDLHIESVFHSDTTDHPGAIYMDVDGRELAGFVPQTGDPVAEWIGSFLADDERADVRKKLSAAETRERHAFVWVPMLHIATWPVVAVLTSAPVPIPTKAPQLPHEITHVWVIRTWGERSGLRWSPATGWSRFQEPPKSAGAKRRREI